MSDAFYINNKNEKINLTVTRHAKKRFIQRWPAAFPDKNIPQDIDLAIVDLFNGASKIRCLSRKEKTRLRRYGKDTLYFRNGHFTIIVKDATVLTIELSSKHLRRFNKCSSGVIKKYSEKSKEIEAKEEYIPSSVKLSAFTLDKDGLPKYVNFGSYPLENGVCSIEVLKNETIFIEYIKEKINDKIKQDSRLIEVLGYYKKDPDKFTIYDQEQVWEYFYQNRVAGA